MLIHDPYTHEAINTPVTGDALTVLTSACGKDYVCEADGSTSTDPARLKLAKETKGLGRLVERFTEVAHAAKAVHAIPNDACDAALDTLRQTYAPEAIHAALRLLPEGVEVMDVYAGLPLMVDDTAVLSDPLLHEALIEVAGVKHSNRQPTVVEAPVIAAPRVKPVPLAPVPAVTRTTAERRAIIESLVDHDTDDLLVEVSLRSTGAIDLFDAPAPVLRRYLATH